MNLTRAKWFKSSRSSGTGQCVEVAFVEEGVALRDTKDRSKPPHLFTNGEWAAFIEGAKDGEFDR
jgi:uncharacterized protein DUF397